MSRAPSPDRPNRRSWRWLPLIVLLAGLGAALLLDLPGRLSLPALQQHRAFLEAFVADHWSAAAGGYVLLYAGVTALSVPAGAVLTLAGGFLFGAWWGTGLVIVGATAGATAVFLIARSAAGHLLAQRAAPWLRQMEAGFREDAWSYLLVLRLIPAFPFFIVNIVPALLGVPLRTYMLATLIGIIPATYVYATVGAGLGSVFARGDMISLTGILTPEIVLGLCGLAVLAILPVVYKRWRQRGQHGRDEALGDPGRVEAAPGPLEGGVPGRAGSGPRDAPGSGRDRGR